MLTKGYRQIAIKAMGWWILGGYLGTFGNKKTVKVKVDKPLGEMLGSTRYFHGWVRILD